MTTSEREAATAIEDYSDGYTAGIADAARVHAEGNPIKWRHDNIDRKVGHWTRGYSAGWNEYKSQNTCD